MFRIAEATSAGLINSGTILTLSPGPTYVEYPESFENVVITSKDGNPIIQAPLRDGRERTWVWVNYRPDVPKYDTLYNTLLQFQYKLRLNATPAEPPWTFLYDDVSDEFSKLVWSGSVWEKQAAWFRVKVISVTRDIRKAGGIVTYDNTTMRFVIDDTTWNAF